MSIEFKFPTTWFATIVTINIVAAVIVIFLPFSLVLSILVFMLLGLSSAFAYQRFLSQQTLRLFFERQSGQWYLADGNDGVNTPCFLVDSIYIWQTGLILTFKLENGKKQTLYCCRSCLGSDREFRLLKKTLCLYHNLEN